MIMSLKQRRMKFKPGIKWNDNIYIRNDEAHQSFLMIFALLPDPLGFYSHDSLSLFLQQHLYITL